MQKDIEAQIKKIIFEINPRVQNRHFDNETDLFENGILDSVLTVELILKLETVYSFKFQFEDLGVENFRTISKLHLLLLGKYHVGVKL